MDYSSLYQKIVRAYSSVPMVIGTGHALPFLQVFIEVTYKCNLRCDFCQFLSAEGRQPERARLRRELTIEELQAIVRRLPGTSIISFTGGEPLVKKGFMDLLEGASQRNKTHIFTNGTRIDNNIAQRLVQLGAKHAFGSGLVLVGVSLEGVEASHDRIVGVEGAYRATISGIERVLAQRDAEQRKYPLVEMKTVISRNNVGELHDLYQLARRLKVDIFNVMTMNMLPQANRISGENGVSFFTPPPPVAKVDLAVLEAQLSKIQHEARVSKVQVRTTPQGIGFDDIVRYYANERKLAERRCFYPWYGLGITAYGDVVLCPYVTGGNLKEADLKQLVNNAAARRFRKQLKIHKAFPGCWGCCMLVPENERHGSP